MNPQAQSNQRTVSTLYSLSALRSLQKDTTREVGLYVREDEFVVALLVLVHIHGLQVCIGNQARTNCLKALLIQQEIHREGHEGLDTEPYTDTGTYMGGVNMEACPCAHSLRFGSTFFGSNTYGVSCGQEDARDGDHVSGPTQAGRVAAAVHHHGARDVTHRHLDRQDTDTEKSRGKSVQDRRGATGASRQRRCLWVDIGIVPHLVWQLLYTQLLVLHSHKTVHTQSCDQSS